MIFFIKYYFKIDVYNWYFEITKINLSLNKDFFSLKYINPLATYNQVSAVVNPYSSI